MSKRINLKEGWNKVAEKYQTLIKISTNEVHYGPNAEGEKKLKLLGNVRRKKVLEIGCGGGQNSIVLAKAGAKTVGIDFSKAQLDYAERLAKQERVNVKFVELDMREVDNLKEKFDIVLSSFAFQYVTDLKPLFRKISQIIRQKGLFVFTIGHPMAYAEKLKKSNKGIAAVIYNYFKKEHRVWYWNFDRKTKFTDFHHRITDVSTALHDSGFIIEKIIEQTAYPPNKNSPYYDPSYDKRWNQIPFSIIFKCVKTKG